MAIIDFHSHILPGIDDGSKNVETSLDMLELISSQGIDVICATPHFYASRDRVEHFLERRQGAYERLSEALPEGYSGPRIFLGAEVAYFDGISRADQVEDLTLQGTKILLLEMPFTSWTESHMDEVASLCDQGYQIIIAHLERYRSFPGNKKRIKQLLELPVSVQINAGSLTDWKRRGPILRMFKKGQAHLLGSDCHGIHHRVPNLDVGRAAVKSKCGEGILSRIDENGTSLLASVL